MQITEQSANNNGQQEGQKEASNSLSVVAEQQPEVEAQIEESANGNGKMQEEDGDPSTPDASTVEVSTPQVQHENASSSSAAPITPMSPRSVVTTASMSATSGE